MTIPPASGQDQAAVFDEEIYLRLNPDVLVAVAAGKFGSGREHYERFGRAEGRQISAPGVMPRGRVIMTAQPDQVAEQPRAPVGSLDAIRISPAGGIYVVGWVNDAQDRLDSIDLFFAGWSVSFDGASLARIRRPDVESAMGLGGSHAYGFWGFLYAARRLSGGSCNVVLRLKSGAERSVMVTADSADDYTMRDIALGQVAQAQYLGKAYYAASASVEGGIGEQLIDFNQMLSRRAVNAPYVERFGRQGASYKASIIVCLYGKPEYLFLQQALFSRHPAMRDYEFIYVSNSPEIAGTLLAEAKRCSLIYGLDMTLVLLNANAGFGAANNVAAQYASSPRLIVMNPDVLPYDQDWAAKHIAVLEGGAAERTRLFGVPLYYDDGSLMHAGMYFEVDTAPELAPGRRPETSLVRVEHYGKGAPPETPRFLRPRPVPAVTGAFISVARDWFEELGGFTEDYIFGHYEDADLCLKSLEAGCVPWLHDVRLYHLEGKGSIRQPVHEGGSAVNRWLFTKTWGEMVRAELLGPAPAHPALRAAEVPA
ncbi:glycosyltransferase family protein [Acidocella aromatica]|uniref:GT2 family glycosyltransferase n=1 Tax=Acidocella aromatica TaxID=1303579 RepID=A0A840VGN9_9PROT|nr:hypothetical protein [Acidocella aromatica]MBB5374067.1 GT2 family glycosyltransferase [Acidocella aromatica]